MPNEVELKFDVEAGGGGLVRAAPAFADVPPRVADHQTLYYDTADGALRAAGFSLRVRRSGDRYVQTVKRRTRSAAGLFVRQESECRVAGPAPDLDALDSAPLGKLLARTKGALVPQVQTRFRRTLWRIERRGSRIEAVLDEGEVTSGKARAPICELELELVEGKPRALFRLAEEIGAAVPLRLGVLSKAERGYALADKALGRAAKAEPVLLPPRASEADAFRAVAHSCLRHFRLNEVVLLERDDAEALHQARVALRRLRSALSLFRPTIRGKTFEALREGLGWLAGRLGEARDLDVLIARREAAGEAAADLAEERAQAYRRVADALASDRTRALLLRLAAWIEAGSWRLQARARRGVAELARRQLDRQWRKLRRQGAAIARLDPAALHRFRVDAKRLRYAAEFLEALYASDEAAERRDRFAAALKALQERLGALTDEQIERRRRGQRPRRRLPTEEVEAAFADAAAAADYWRA